MRMTNQVPQEALRAAPLALSQSATMIQDSRVMTEYQVASIYDSLSQ